MGHASRDQGTIRVLAGLVLAAALAGCADYKKLSRGGSMVDVMVYDVLGQDRPPADYFQYVRDSHMSGDFCYACGNDNFLVDKNIDAVQRLGDASFGRLEGEAQVLELFTEVLLEDCSALARSSAATSITKIGLKLPEYPYTPVPDDGSRLLAMVQELDRMHGADCRLRVVGPASVRRKLELVTQIGNLEFKQYLNTRNAIKPFYDRPYLVDETAPLLRQAIDTALVKRMQALISQSLQSAVDDRDPGVRADALRALKTLGDRRAAPVVVSRMQVETQWLVKIEGIEYLGKVGTREGVVTLVKLLGDPNASVRSKARLGLVRIAGRDFGERPDAWEYWARQVDPSIEFGDAGEGGDEPPRGS